MSERKERRDRRGKTEKIKDRGEMEMKMEEAERRKVER